MSTIYSLIYTGFVRTIMVCSTSILLMKNAKKNLAKINMK